MFELTGQAPQAADLFVQATALLGGRDPRQMVAADPAPALHHNRIGQILCALQALAAAALLRQILPIDLIVAGYSVGEVAAWGVGGQLSPALALELVARRAEAMDAASPVGDGLLFVRGLPRGQIDSLCRRHAVWVAIVNPQEAFVLGGAGGALDALAVEAAAAGASRVTRVGVDVASHTPRLAAATTAFRKMILDAPLRSCPHIRLLSGIDAEAVLDPRAGAEKLALQISHPLAWSACLTACVEAGGTTFLELGPGRALAQMAASVAPDARSRSLDDFSTADGVAAWLLETVA
jgi:[acyl-carrier-protein] S-malonyltransferase